MGTPYLIRKRRKRIKSVSRSVESSTVLSHCVARLIEKSRIFSWHLVSQQSQTIFNRWNNNRTKRFCNYVRGVLESQACLWFFLLFIKSNREWNPSTLRHWTQLVLSNCACFALFFQNVLTSRWSNDNDLEEKGEEWLIRIWMEKNKGWFGFGNHGNKEINIVQ